jgi:cbb3-type cytochrome oxidase subunit 3
MDSFVVGVQVLLAGVFLLAGGAKLFDLRGSRRAVADFGVPVRAASVLGVALPLAELATGVLLLVPGTGGAGAIAALVLLLCFVAGVARAMRKGLDVDCGCFGPVYSAVAGSATLARNAVLAALAAVVLAHGSVQIDDWVADRAAGELLAAIAILLALAGAVAWWLWKQNRDLSRARADRAASGEDEPTQAPQQDPQGLPVGTPAPGFELRDLRGEVQTLDSLLADGLPVALAFMAAGCGPCGKLRPELARWRSAFGGRITVGIISSGTTEQVRERWQEVDVDDVLLDPSDKVLLAYRLRATPACVLIAPDGTIASTPAAGVHGAEVLFREALRSAPARPAVPATAPG